MKFKMFLFFLFPLNLFALTPGQEIAKLTLKAPSMNEFLLRGTIPIPAKLFPKEPNHFVIVDSTGELSTQTEIVSSYPHGSDGADVVEVMARVKRHVGVLPGQIIHYRINYSPKAAPSLPTFSKPRAALRSVSGLPAFLTDLLNQSNPVILRTRDVFGNVYEASILNDSNSFEILKQGENLVEVRTYTTLTPKGTEPLCIHNPVQGCALRHLMGVNAYITAMKGESILRINLHFNNGPTGLSASNPHDDPVGKIYFDALEMIYPNGWTIRQQGVDPFFRPPAIVRSIHEVYPSHPVNALHSMDIFSQFHRRLALTPMRLQTRADALLREEGLGFATKGASLYSWWNKDTARYYPQRFKLPSLPNATNLNQMIENNADVSTPWATPLNTILSVLNTGNPGVFPLLSPVLGWAHPHGETYGGGPGGSELAYWDGAETAISASHLGILRHMLLHRMAMDRTPTGAFRADGSEIEYNDFVTGSQFKLNVFNGKIMTDNLHYLGYNVHNYVLTQNYQQTVVATQCRYGYYDNINPCNLAPSQYGLDLKQYDPYDSEHRVRGWRMMLPLAWLANDSLAKSDIRMEAQLFQMSFTHLPLEGGYITGVSLKSREKEITSFPDRGFSIGRYEGWGMQIASAAYSLSDRDWRIQRLAWWYKIVDVLEKGQCKCPSSLYCDGVMSRKTWIPFEWNPGGGVGWCNNILGVNQCGNIPGTQSFENDILMNGMWSMYSSVLETADPIRADKVKKMIVRLAKALTSERWMPPGNAAPWNHLVIGGLDGKKFCSATGTDLGFGVHGDHPYPYYDKNSLAAGYHFSNDPYFIDKINRMTGGKTALISKPTHELGMTQALQVIAEDL